MNYLRTDQYTELDPRCTVATELHPVDNVVEVTFGDHHSSCDTLRLVLDSPDTCHRIARVFQDAGHQLSGHLRTNDQPSSATSQADHQPPAGPDEPASAAS